MNPCVDPVTGLRMKPSCLAALTVLRKRNKVTTHQLLNAGCGSRFGARLKELRDGPDKNWPDRKFVIDEQRLSGDVSGSEYELLAEPEPVPIETPTHRGDGNEDRVGPRDDRLVSAGAVSTNAEPTSGPAPGADLTRQAPASRLVAQSPDGEATGRRDDPIQTPVRDAANPAGSRTAGPQPEGCLFDTAAYRDTSPYEEAA